MIKFVLEAVERFRREGDTGIDWVYFMCMTEEDRINFDKMLVETKDVLSTIAGTIESRFKAKVKNIGRYY